MLRDVFCLEWSVVMRVGVVYLALSKNMAPNSYFHLSF